MKVDMMEPITVIMSHKYSHIRAAEEEVAAICPLNCVYCYIPKHPYMKKLHKALIESIRSGKHLDTLKRHFGKELESLGLWGTEPTIILDVIQEELPRYLETFPNLKEISFSTSLLTDISYLERFARFLTTLDRKMELSVQVSVDGPSFTTDVNRFQGAAEKIPKNFRTLVRTFNNWEKNGGLTVEFRWKATISIDNMKTFLTDDYLVDAYFGYFKRLNNTFNEMNGAAWVKLKGGTYAPTLVVPGKYTQRDGLIFTQFLEKLHELDYDTTYTYRMKKLYDWSHETYKKFMFTCSGGDSNFGIGDKIHLCHRTFFIEDEGYINAILETDIDNWDVSHFERGMLKHIREKFIVDPEDEAARLRLLYVMRGYHDFWKFEMQSIMATMKELAIAGQVRKEYLEDDWLCERFSMFIVSAMGCPMENLLNTGSVHVVPLSILRLWGNGAFQELLRRFRVYIKKKTTYY